MIGRVPQALRPWLLARGSLTRHLIDTAAGAFRVECVHEAWVAADADAARWLGVRVGRRLWRREVRLCGTGVPWVEAVTLATEAACRRLRLQTLGTRALGAVLYRERGRRARFALLAPNATRPWARRTLHVLQGGARLTVQEAFLPALPARRRCFSKARLRPADGS